MDGATAPYIFPFVYLFFFLLQCVICFGGTEKLGRTKTKTRGTVPFAPLQGNRYRSQSFLLSLPSSSLFSLLFYLLLLFSVSHPFSGRTPDELVLQAHSLRLIQLHKKIVEHLTAKKKGKKNNWIEGNVSDPQYFIRSCCDKELQKVWVSDLLRRRANSNLWQHLTGETNPQGVHLKVQDCEGEYDSGILKQQAIYCSLY